MSDETSPAEPAPVRDRLLDAAVEVAATHGLARLSVGDVAKQAGLSRQTLYKHFASKDDLVAQALLREAGAMVEEVVAEADTHDDPQASLEAAIVTSLRLARAHPMLDRLVRTEPEALLPLLVGGASPVAGAIRSVVEHVLTRHVPDLPPAEVALAADLLSRLLISYSVNPPDASPEDVAHAMSTIFAAGLERAVQAPTR